MLVKLTRADETDLVPFSLRLPENSVKEDREKIFFS